MSEKVGIYVNMPPFEHGQSRTSGGMPSSIGLPRSWRRSISYAAIMAVGMAFYFGSLPSQQQRLMFDPFMNRHQVLNYYFAPNWRPKTTPTVEMSSTCERCDASPNFCRLYGDRALDVTRAYEGSGDRVRRVLRKAMAGQPVVIGALGGSVSIGQACDCAGKIWNEQVAQWWNRTFPHPENRFVNGAVGAKGSVYFSFCHSEHLPQDLDLALLEFGTNDGFTEQSAFNMEALLRAILEYPNKPAAIISDSFRLMNGAIGGGSDAHAGVAAYYDVPHLATRPWALPAMLGNSKMVKEYFVEMGPFDEHGRPLDPNKQSDLLHPNVMGHTMMADMTIAYLEQQLCFIRRGLVTPPLPEFADWIPQNNALPRQSLGEYFDPDVNVRLKPVAAQCSRVEDGSVRAIKSLTSGFELWQDPQHGGAKYWHAEEEGAKIAFEFEAVLGRVGLMWLRGSGLQMGKLKCWVDDEEDKSELLWGWWHSPVAASDLAVVRDDVKGRHILNCRVAPNPTNGVDAGFRFDIMGLVVA